MSKAKISILVVDDDPEIVAMLTTRLGHRGYKVSTASDGVRALELAKKEHPDVVLLDVMMPGKSGWEVCKRIREDISLAHTAVLMLTGIGEKVNELTSPLYGADAHIDKPFEFEKLEQVIVDLIA